MVKKTSPVSSRCGIAEAMYSHAGRACRDNASSTTNLDRQKPPLRRLTISRSALHGMGFQSQSVSSR
jgi:hypothetical protein